MKRPLAAGVVVALLAGALILPATAATAAGRVKLTPTDDGRIKVSWSGSGTFQVRTSSSQDLGRDVHTYRTSKNSIVVKPAKNAGYGSGNFTFVNVYSGGSALAGYPFPHAQVKVATPDPDAARVTVATFNVRSAENEEPGHSWTKRLPAVAAQIDASGAGVVALQEAGALSGSFALPWQFDELEAAVHPAYELVYRDEYRRGPNAGKEGTRILYDSTRYSVVQSGYFNPSAVTSSMRWVPWALFSETATGRQFYFMSVHLENGKDKGKQRRLYNLRMKQIGEVIRNAQAFAASGRQVIVAGDLNSNIYSLPKNGVHQKLIAAGFYDAYATDDSTNAYFDTYNFFGKSIVGASRTDYILTLGGPPGSYRYEQVIARSKPIASDHNLQIATVPF